MLGIIALVLLSSLIAVQFVCFKVFTKVFGWIVKNMKLSLFALVLALIWPPSATAQDVFTTTENENPTVSQIALGRMLFFDKRLSTTNEKSCASCHDPAHGYTDDTPVSEGVNGQLGKRRAMTCLNAVYKRALFHDGRALFLEGQATQPIQAAAEMGNQTLEGAFRRLDQRAPGYRRLFADAYGTNVNSDSGILAIAAFERTLVSSEAPIDHYADGQTWIFTKSEERGRKIFFGAGQCVNCHSGRNFTDGQFHNILGVVRDRDGQLDIGRGQRTGRQRDNFKFVTPSLRDLAKHPPYFHDGRFKDLGQVVEYLNDPVRGNGAELKPLGLNAGQQADLVAFLKVFGESDHYPLVTRPVLP